jgi:hypothetical protein
VSEIERIFQQVVESGPRRRGPSMKTVRDWNGEGAELCERATSQDLTKLVDRKFMTEGSEDVWKVSMSTRNARKLPGV